MTTMPTTARLPKTRNRPQMTDEQADTLRASVPDDPITTPSDSLACESCGIAVVQPKPVATTYPESVTPAGRTRFHQPVQFSRCEGCQATRERAETYVAEHPRFGNRVGPEIARERIESVLFGLAVLGKDATGSDLTLMLPRMHPASAGVRYSNPRRETQGRCTKRPWAHVSLADRAALRKAYAESLRDSLAVTQPPVAIRCPSRACLLCGIATVNRSAIEVTRAGGAAAIAQAVWRPVWTTPKALGGNGPEQVWGHVCPACDRAIQEENAIGWATRVQALFSHVALTSLTKAVALENDVLGDSQPLLPAWAVSGERTANPHPWAHLQRYLSRL